MSDDDLAAEEFWVCAASPELDSSYQAIVDAAMVERTDERGKDLRAVVRSVRVDRQLEAVEMRIDAGDAGERDGFADELLDLDAVGGLHRTTNGPFENCRSVLDGSSGQA